MHNIFSANKKGYNMALPTSYITAMKHFFGMKTGQTLTEFSVELKALSDDEREWFKQGLRENGYEIPAA